ncbi:kynureninase [Porticoccaceae bacterium LTM1]|nr:kynureninase [Porticoccaceae bacterium LTM1]
MHDFNALAERLAPHYSRFNVANRLLFSGHSHQAWPDVAVEGQIEAFDAAARSVDEKWHAAFEKADILRNYLREWYDDPEGLYCLAENTHILLVSWLSAILSKQGQLKSKPKIITTDGEFHSMYRQLKRLQEEGVEVVMLPAEPFATFPERLAAEADDRTAAIMLSRVYFESSLIHTHLREVAQVGRDRQIPVLIDDYHGTNNAPLSLRDEGLEDCYLVTGGYKYLQWGEGNCFLRFPKSCELRPVITGWFASFSTLDKPRTNEPTVYDAGEQRFSTATYDPTSQFRGAKVVEFFRDQQLTKEVIRQQYLGQLGYLRELFLNANFNPDTIRLVHQQSLETNGGFLALHSPHAAQLRQMLLENDVLTDSRGSVLRFGVAPYVTASQIDQAMEQLARCIDKL